MADVLVCEDDPYLAADLVQSIEAAGHRVCGIYASASAALADAQELKPDIAIIDLNLTDGDTGVTVAQELQRAGARVVIVSGHTNAREGLGSIPHTYAAKPVSDQLVQHLLNPSFAAS